MVAFNQREYSLEDVEKHCERNDAWIVVGGKVYDVTSWVEKHPGGQLPILNLAGRDATVAFQNFHPPAVKQQLKAFCVGSLKAAQGDELTEDYKKLKRELEARGLFRQNWSFYMKEVGFILCLLLLLLRLLGSTSPVVRCLGGGITLGMFWQQVAFVGHDIGHNAFTGVRTVDAALGIVAGNFLTGIGVGWWKATHNVHHVVVNSVDHDPDIQHMPFMAISDKFFNSIYSRYHMDTLLFTPLARKLVSIQHKLFFPLLMVARYGLVLQGIKTVGWEWHKRHTGFLAPGATWVRLLEGVGFICYFAYVGALLSLLPVWWEKLLVVLLSHATFSILHLQINLSHWSRHVYMGLPEGSWVQTQMSGTMNWNCPEWMDWFHGGLQFQIEHHLFPRMPRPNLRKASKYVQAFCKKHQLEYRTVGFYDATMEIMATLHTTALAAGKLAKD